MVARTLIVVAMQLLTVSALPWVTTAPPGSMKPNQLRGAEPTSDPAEPAGISPVAEAPAPVAEYRGERGHFYYSDDCDDCYYKSLQCGCEPVVEYFACLTKHCHASNHSKFTEKCSALGSKCASELDIDCRASSTVCTSKYNQLPTGGLGLTLNLTGMEDDAFCGPFGACVGQIHMKVNVYNPPAKPAPDLVVASPAPAAVAAPTPAAAAAPVAPEPPVYSVAAVPPPVAAGVWVECGIPSVPNADVENQTHWTLCRAQVIDDKAACDLPVPAMTLEASQSRKAYCLLTEGADGNPLKRLTSPAWHVIRNAHDKASDEEAAKAEAPTVMKTQATEQDSTPWGELEESNKHYEDSLPWMRNKKKD